MAKLDGECTMSFKMLTRKIDSFVDVKCIAELDGLVFNITNVKKVYQVVYVIPRWNVNTFPIS